MRELLQLIFPVRCAGCDRYDANAFCLACQEMIPAGPTYFHAKGVDSGIGLGPYAKPFREAILDLKFNHKKMIAEVLGERMAQVVKKAGWRPDWIVPVPMAKSRSR